MKQPQASSEAALRRMRSQARRDTKPELALRRALWARGLRYRVEVAPIGNCRRRADLVFVTCRVAVFVDGCFWHCCPEHSTLPASNAEWWANKLAANVRRDRDTTARLIDEGWHVERVWEHESPDAAADRIERIVRARRRPHHAADAALPRRTRTRL